MFAINDICITKASKTLIGVAFDTTAIPLKLSSIYLKSYELDYTVIHFHLIMINFNLYY